MLSDINLLPQKPKRSILFIILIILLFVCGMLGNGATIYYYQVLEQDKEIKQQQLVNIQQLRETEQTNIQERSQFVTAILEYNQIVDSLDEVTLQTVLVVNHLTALLPQSGYFTSYTYTDKGTVEITAEFDSLEAVAEYLHHLTYSDSIAAAEVLQIEDCACDNENEVGNENENESAVGTYTAQFYIELRNAAFRYQKGVGQ